LTTGFGHRPVHARKIPVDALQFIELLNASLPELQKHIGPHPLLKTIVGRRMRHQLGLIQRLPLAAGA